MWYYDSKIIKSAKTMVISGITHPPAIFQDSTMLASLGIKPYTETRKDVVLNADNTFKEYHASNTTDFARTINMTAHFTVHPNKIDAGLVSLTAD